MTAYATPTTMHVGQDRVLQALSTVVDPELDEPITDLGFVRSLEIDESPDGATVVMHLRLPTSFCSPNFAYLMTSDAKDAIAGIPGVSRVVVELDDHHDSDLINAGLAADAGYKGTFGHEAEKDLDELRRTFQRKAHTAAMERCLTDVLRSDPSRSEKSLASVRLRDLPDGRLTEALFRRRSVLGLSTKPDALVLVDVGGQPYAPDEIPLALRRARSTRISIDGNAHFCRGLLKTRYPDAAGHLLIPLTVKESQA